MKKLIWFLVAALPASVQLVEFVRADVPIQCGESGADSKPPKRIFHGQLAQPGEFPFQAYFADNGTFMCGGVIIDERHVLTTASCFHTEKGKHYMPATLQVVIGAHQMNGTEHQLCTPKDITWHPKFKPNSKLNDIAVVRLNQKIKWELKGAGSVNRICMPPDRSVSYSRVYATGWGMTESGTVSNKLRFVGLEAESCERGLVCTERTGSAQKSPCWYDRGGPLFRYVDGVAELIGVIAWTPRCSTGGDWREPTRSTRVTENLDWIYEMVKKFDWGPGIASL